MNITITDENLAGTTADPAIGDAFYLVAFTRDPEQDYHKDAYTPEGIEARDNLAAIKQLAKELQEAYDYSGIGGNFTVLTRTWRGKTVTVQEAEEESELRKKRGAAEKAQMRFYELVAQANALADDHDLPMAARIES